MSDTTIFQFIASLFSKQKTAEKSVSAVMQSALEEWLSLYRYGGGDDNDSKSLDLPAAISSEFARLVLAESDIHVDGSQFLEDQFQRFFYRFITTKAETAFALGSMAFKPYVSDGKILVDMIRADRFVPTAFDDAGEATAAVFMARKTIGQSYYTRLETHTWDPKERSYVVENRAYCSMNRDALGWECSLSSVPGWAHLTERQPIANVEKPLFAIYRNPVSNTIDMDSSIGISVYAHAVDLIREAGKQWARIQWEYKGTELAIDASADLFRKDRKTGKLKDLPARGDRLFRRYLLDDRSISEDLQVFSPAIRDVSLFNGLNRILQRIEYNVGLAYGTLSEPADIEKTAEEIRTSKHRSYEQVGKMQRTLQGTLEQLLYAMGVYAQLYELTPAADVSLTCTWGDSVLEDTDKEFQRRMQLVTGGMLSKEKFLSWYFGCTEEEAAAYLPMADSLFSGGGLNADTLRV